MRVFIAYGYNERDQWIKDAVFRVIRAFGDDVVTGELAYDGAVPDAIVKKIRSSDAVIGFLTRRKQTSPNLWTTHNWVIRELAQGQAFDLYTLPVVEDGVDPEVVKGTEAMQRIDYREEKRADAIVQIVEAVASWHFSIGKVQILPREIARELYRAHHRGDLVATYVVRNGNDVSEKKDADLVPEAGGVFLTFRGVPRDALLQLSVKLDQRRWVSDFESPDSPAISLTEV